MKQTRLFLQECPCKLEGQWGQSRWADLVIVRLCLCVLASCLKSHLVNLFFVASDDNGRKLGCASATARFHCVMCFQWHPGWCAVVFSSHCNSDSKTVWLIVLWSFHVLHKAGKVGQGNGCFVLSTQRRGTLQNHSADNNTLMVLISSSSSLFTQWLRPPEEGRCDLFEVRVEV